VFGQAIESFRTTYARFVHPFDSRFLRFDLAKYP
jgi:cytochrome c peroxidase